MKDRGFQGPRTTLVVVGLIPLGGRSLPTAVPNYHHFPLLGAAYLHCSLACVLFCCCFLANMARYGDDYLVMGDFDAIFSDEEKELVVDVS